MRFFGSSTKKLEEVYNSIDTLPQWLWVSVHKTGNLAYIKKLNSYKNIEVDLSERLDAQWTEIYDEYIEEFGLNEAFLEQLEDKKRLAQLQNDYVIHGKKVTLNHIRIAQNRIEDKDEKIEIDLRETVANMEKFQGVPIGYKKITVSEYNTYIKLMNKSNGKED